jgi:RNA polymerase sigma-70 factor, ECF subfamily
VAQEHVELARRCLEGDERALREFVETFQHQVFGLCLRMLGHRQDAEDVAQESLVRAVRYLKSWDPDQPLAPWVMKIAANRCRTALGKRARRPVPSESIPEESVSGETEQLSLSEELERALRKLNENHRLSFIMFYQQEMSVAEIASVLEVPPGTVKTWLHRGRKQLAEILTHRGMAPTTQESQQH